MGDYRNANAPARRGRLLSDGLRCSLVTGRRTLPASNVPGRLLDDGHRQVSKPLAVLKRQVDIATDEGSMGSQELWQRAAARKCRERLHVHLKPVLSHCEPLT
jgi:hypothetical protein